MEHHELLQKQNKMLKCLSALPRRMVQLQGVENLTEFVFHDLCNKDCFNFDRAAFFVDNPDFDCTKGVAGFNREQAFQAKDTIWCDVPSFTDHMRSSPFNKQVRSLMLCSLRKNERNEQDLAKDLAHDLGFTNYAYCTWDMRHHNHGFLVYERADECDVATQELILDGLSVLSFCPVF